MTIKLHIESDVGNRAARLDFPWEESMGEYITVVNPDDPNDKLELKIRGLLDSSYTGSAERIWHVLEKEGLFSKFDEVLKYGFVEVIGWADWRAPALSRRIQ